MGYEPIKAEELQDILASQEKLKILLDSNVLIAFFDKTHKFNYVAHTIIDPLKDKNCYFFIPTIVLGEFINKWIDLKKETAKNAIKIIRDFLDKEVKFSLVGGTILTQELVLSGFAKHSRHKNFLKAHFNDFMILFSAESVNNIKIVTCDKAMHDAGKNIFEKDIYYIPFNTKKGKSGLTRFINDMSKYTL